MGQRLQRRLLNRLLRTDRRNPTQWVKGFNEGFAQAPQNGPHRLLRTDLQHLDRDKISFQAPTEWGKGSKGDLSEAYAAGLAQGSGFFRVGQDSGRQLAEDVAAKHASEQEVLNTKLKAQLAEVKKENLKISRLAARSTKDYRRVRKVLQDERELRELYFNGYSSQLKVNKDLKKDFEESQAKVRQLEEGFLDTLARNQFLENRNAWYYANFHGVAEELEGPLQEDEDKPPSQGPL